MDDFQGLSRYLKLTVSPIRRAMLLDIYQRLLTVFGDEFPASVDNFISTLFKDDKETGLDKINEQTLVYLKEAITRYGITLNSSVIDYDSIPVLGELLSGLIEIEVYEDPDQLLAIMETSEEAVTGLMDVISYLTNYSTSMYLNLISNMNTDLVNNAVKSLLNNSRDRVIREEEAPIELNQYLVKFIKLGLHQKVDERALSLLKDDPHKLSIRSILRLLGNRLADDREGVYNWVFVVLISSEPDNINQLYELWTPYFLEDTILMNMRQLTEQAWGKLHE
nr:MAG TPA: hypothetical protein [Caudoviricetes sp.]